MRTIDEDWLRRAIELSRQAVESGEGAPFGAVVVRDGEKLAEGWNQSRKMWDPTSHAEMNAIRTACQREKSLTLAGSTMYASGHPCPMCMAAMHWVRIDRLVYGSSPAETAAAAPGLSDAHVRAGLTGEAGGPVISSEQLLRDEAVEVIALWNERATG